MALSLDLVSSSMRRNWRYAEAKTNECIDSLGSIFEREVHTIAVSSDAKEYQIIGGDKNGDDSTNANAVVDVNARGGGIHSRMTSRRGASSV
jgi:hypothetical protein